MLTIEYDPKDGKIKYQFYGVEIREEEAQPLLDAMGKTQEAKNNQRDVEVKLAEKLEKEGRAKWRK